MTLEELEREHRTANLLAGAIVDWYVRALIEEPRGFSCASCSAINYHFDDCGWWYDKLSDGEFHPVCENCAPAHYGDR